LLDCIISHQVPR